MAALDDGEVGAAQVAFAAITVFVVFPVTTLMLSQGRMSVAHISSVCAVCDKAFEEKKRKEKETRISEEAGTRKIIKKR